MRGVRGLGAGFLLALAACAVHRPDAAAFARLRSDVAFLTGARCEGRATGSAGGLAARARIADLFRSLGLRPLGSRFEHPFSVACPGGAVTPDPENTWLRTGAGGATLGDDFVPFGFSPAGDAFGRAVFVGYGDYDELDVEGAVVVLVRGAPGWRERRQDSELVQRISFASKIADAARHGAVGVVFVDDLRAGSAPLRAASAARGVASIPSVWASRDLVSTWWRRRGLPTCRSLDAAQRDGGRGPLGFDVRLRVRFRERPVRLQTANVVGVLPGPKGETSPCVVVGAHYDHLGRGETGLAAPRFVDRLHPGANDNASGVAALCEVARRLVVAEPLPFAVAFVAFGAEELGLAGSRAFLSAETVPRGEILAMLNLEMLGRVDSAGLRIDGVGSAPGWSGLLADLGESELRAHASPRSDHWSFLLGGVPAVVFHSGVTAEYHTPADVAALVEISGLARAALAVESTVHALARRGAPLRFDPSVLRGSFLERK